MMHLRVRPILIISILGDGNCFYRTIAFLLCVDQEQYDTVKGALQHFLIVHQKNFPLKAEKRALLTAAGGNASDLMILVTETYLNIRVYLYSSVNGGKSVPKCRLEIWSIKDLAVGDPANGGIYINHRN